MNFKPLSRVDRWHALLAMLALTLLDVVIVQAVARRSVDGLSFALGLWVLVSLLILAYLGYRTACAFRLEYWVDRDGVTLVWGPTRQIVPMGQILRIQQGVAGRPTLGPRPWHWPCPDRRRMQCGELGVLNSYATRPPSEQIILVTREESFGISPVTPEVFLAALQARYALGPARELRMELRRPPLWTWPLWQDRAALFLIGVGLVGVLVMFGVLCLRFPALSSDLPLHFAVSGVPDRIAPKAGLFALPMIGFLTWTSNLMIGTWLYRHIQQGGAYLLWGGAVVVQFVAGLALATLMRW